MKINTSLLLFPLLGLILVISESVSIILNKIMFVVGCGLIIIPIVILLYQISKSKKEEEKENEKEQHQEGT